MITPATEKLLKAIKDAPKPYTYQYHCFDIACAEELEDLLKAWKDKDGFYPYFNASQGIVCIATFDPKSSHYKQPPTVKMGLKKLTEQEATDLFINPDNRAAVTMLYDRNFVVCKKVDQQKAKK